MYRLPSLCVHSARDFGGTRSGLVERSVKSACSSARRDLYSRRFARVRARRGYARPVRVSRARASEVAS